MVATLVEPVTAALVAAAFLGERLGPAGLVGIVLVVAAIAGTGRTGSHLGEGPAAVPVADLDPAGSTVSGFADGR